MKLSKTLLVVSLLWSSFANAAFLQDIDQDLFFANSNDTIANAQTSFTVLPGNSYEINGSIVGNDQDFYKIVFSPGYQYDLDITVIAPNGQTGAQDPDLYIYDVAENLYGFDADSGPGGINTANAFISATFEPGTYYFGVSRGIKSSSDFNYSFSININQVTPVPEPESGALVALGLGVIGFISRRKRQ